GALVLAFVLALAGEAGDGVAHRAGDAAAEVERELAGRVAGLLARLADPGAGRPDEVLRLGHEVLLADVQQPLGGRVAARQRAESGQGSPGVGRVAHRWLLWEVRRRPWPEVRDVRLRRGVAASSVSSVSSALSVSFVSSASS